MKFEEMAVAARELSQQEAHDSLRALVADPRFASVLRLILDQKELAGDSSCQLKFADQPGCLAHAAGVRYGMLELEGRIREICQPAKKRGAGSGVE